MSALNEIGERVGQSASRLARFTGLRNLSVRSKLLLMILLTSLLSAGVISYVGYRNGRAALLNQTFDQLVSLRSSKKQQIEWYFNDAARSFSILGEDLSVSAALLRFRESFALISPKDLSDDDKAAIRAFYLKEMMPRLAAMENPPTLDELLPDDPVALYLQSLFIAKNPYPIGEKAKLDTTEIANPYALSHETFHDWFRKLAEQKNFYDVFLIDGKSGNILYSTGKEIDFATSLQNGPHAYSLLGRLFRQVRDEQSKGKVYISDFEHYAPSYGKPSSFIAVPIFSNWKFVGVLAAQLSVDALNSFVTGGYNWENDGLGKSGEIILAGEDRRMRTVSRFMHEDPGALIAAMKERKIDTVGLERYKTTILTLPLDTEPVRRALDGKSGIDFLSDYRGTPVLASYTPLTLPNLKWVLVAKIDEAEAMAPLRDFQRSMMIIACLIALLSTLAAMALAGVFLKPVNALIEGLEQMRDGRTDVTVESHSNDEFGALTKAFNAMTTTIRERNEVIASKSTAYQALLKRIFPDVVAERMRAGEANIVDSFPQVSTVYAIVHGFVPATAAMAPEDGIKLLNEIVDTIDAEAEAIGIEKVKTIGEHYLAVCGLGIPRLDHARRAMEFADALGEAIHRINGEKGLQLSLRVGIASGVVHAGLVGNRRFVYDVWGRTVNVARRIVYESDLDAICISEETFKLLGEPEGMEQKSIQSRTLGTLPLHQCRVASAVRRAGEITPAGDKPGEQASRSAAVNGDKSRFKAGSGKGRKTSQPPAIDDANSGPTATGGDGNPGPATQPGSATVSKGNRS